MNAELFFHSAGDERATPTDFFTRLNAEFNFTLDAAASSLNHKVDTWFGEGGIAFNALEEDWGGEGQVVWLNPPYSVAGAFVAKAREEAEKGAVVVMLLPARTDTKWWHSYVWSAEGLLPGVECRFVKGRLSFELKVPEEMRALIVENRNEAFALGPRFDEDAFYRQIVEITGLPKMAIEGILQGKPDEDLLSSAPFPSAVVIFRRVE